ncbi:MAG: signal peptidase I [Eggerthellaceae bacterium]|nr:signal peptidase I [Eggerthellaceae bacterium]
MDSGQHAAERPHSALRSFLSIVIMVAVVAIITVLLRLFVFVPYEIPSGSMEETIMTGDMVFSEKVTYYFREPQRGDIVTFDDPEVAGRTLIKRVIAVGGQTVDLVDGKVVVDGVTVDEPYTNGKESYPLSRTATDVTVEFPYTVPSGYVWVMGDNRTSSQDSRYFGAIPVSSITGRAALVYWPFSDFGLLS